MTFEEIWSIGVPEYWSTECWEGPLLQNSINPFSME